MIAPAPGQVVAYSYLWRAEARRGEDSGRKTRPCLIVLTAVTTAEGTRVVVAPISHTPPDDSGRAIEMPHETKRRLGPDQERSWIVLDDLNQFFWPGPDLRPIGRGRPGFVYGVIPQALLAETRRRVAALAKAGRVRPTPRAG